MHNVLLGLVRLSVAVMDSQLQLNNNKIKSLQSHKLHLITATYYHANIPYSLVEGVIYIVVC